MMNLAILGVVIAAVPLMAENPQPTCHHCPATYIPKSELDAYTERAIANHIVDQQVRSIDLGKVQIGIGMVTRGRLVPGPNRGRPVAEHEQVSEVYHVIDGSATLLTGPDLIDAEKRPSTMTTVRLQNGPGFNAKSIQDPVVHELHAGDVIVIPAGTGHWFTKIDDHITYLMVRIDPDKVVPLKSEAQSKAYLASPAK
jgi:mannose-6-phosphate isomerase-like protein (cupin superfamily)